MYVKIKSLKTVVDILQKTVACWDEMLPSLLLYHDPVMIIIQNVCVVDVWYRYVHKINIYCRNNRTHIMRPSKKFNWNSYTNLLNLVCSFICIHKRYDCGFDYLNVIPFHHHITIWLHNLCSQNFVVKTSNM